MTSPVPTFESPIVRGDKHVEAFVLSLDEFDFTGATIRAQTRATPDGDLLAEPTITANTATTGIAECTLTIDPADTETFPQTCVTEVEIDKVGWELGPKTVLRLQHAVDPDWCHD